MERVAELHECLKTEQSDLWDPNAFKENVKKFFELLRSKLENEVSYTNKLHVLESHLPDLVDSYGILGPYSEQGTESLHFLMDERMDKFKNRQNCTSKSDFMTKKLEYSMRIHYQLVFLNDKGLLY